MENCKIMVNNNYLFYAQLNFLWYLSIAVRG